MRFMLMHRVQEDDPASWEPNAELIERMNGFIDKLTANGVLLGAEGVQKVGSVVRRRGTAVKSIDGPFAEAKEVVGGFVLINAKDLAEATAVAEEYITCFAGVEEMSVEVRQVAEMEDIEPYLNK
ncbi:YciI family protein [Lentzea sp. BCCO 10_0856]|uniref:YciI family protein n=1 Tax=Lentzea miocenica TaxID=3095431 RepID=A0ABU4SW69_9PSEU|nr:YciI family protein [Lentzea sp. BCCO 10_0856]MDX8030054.1 YciI family protein [Lentzea sp. BCCO 10_0856]